MVTDHICFNFGITPVQKDALMHGLDAIGITLQKADSIDAFEKLYLESNPWVA